MIYVKALQMGPLAALFISLVAGGLALSDTANENLKGYTFYPGIGYLQGLTEHSYNWSQAFQECILRKSHLAVSNSEEEAEVYKQIIARHTLFQDTVYIGFHDLFVNGEYETVHDTPLAQSGYNQWALGAPNVSPALRCGGFSKDGGLLNLDCATKTACSFICELPPWIEYKLVPGLGYYKLHTHAKSWLDAWKACRDEESHLAVINSEEEHRALQEIFADHPIIPEADDADYAWVGVHSDLAYNTFRTVLGTSLDEAGYSKWQIGYPASGISREWTDVVLVRNQDYLSMRHTLASYSFFCEHELPNGRPTPTP